MFRKTHPRQPEEEDKAKNSKQLVDPRGLRYPPWQSAFSTNALNRAWIKVQANKGAAGDGQTIAQFADQLQENLHQLRAELLSQTYRPKGVKQILVPKSKPGWRPVTLWAIRDRIAQRAVYDYLEPIWDPRFMTCSFGFRPGLSTTTVMHAIKAAHQKGFVWVLDADIKDCFGTMRDERIAGLLGQWCVPYPLQKLVNAWLAARVLNAWRGSRKTAGTSQGGVISPLLCNLYLHDFDRRMADRKWRMMRYADDFLILAKDLKTIKKARHQVDRNLRRISLTLHPQKTRVTSFEQGFQFVGWFFVGDNSYRLR